MKEVKTAAAIVGLAVLTGCQVAETPRVSGGQLIELDARTRLLVAVEGIETRPTPVEFVGIPKSKDGAPIHRILESGDGKVLFRYDLTVSKTGDGGAYHFLLKPARPGPTLDSSREVTVEAHDDAVRVELMEQPGTGRKVVDVFKLLDIEGNAPERHATMIGLHMQRVHAFFRDLFHGN